MGEEKVENINLEEIMKDSTLNNPDLTFCEQTTYLDFLLSNAAKLVALEVKSSGTGKHESLNQFRKIFANVIEDTCIVSQKDMKRENGNRFLPVYTVPFLL